MRRVALLALLLAAPVVLAQNPLTLAGPAKARDTTDHVDLVVGTSAPITLTGARRAVTWSSSDLRIVRVSSAGVVTGRQRGYAVITARSGTRSASLQACVTAEPLHELGSVEGIPGNSMTITLGQSTIVAGGSTQAGYIMPLRATDPVDNRRPPNRCIHWALTTGPLIPTLDSSVVWLTRDGIVHAPTGIREFYVSASVGPRLPSLSQLRRATPLRYTTRVAWAFGPGNYSLLQP